MMLLQATVRNRLKLSAEKHISNWIAGYVLAGCLYDCTSGEAQSRVFVLEPQRRDSLAAGTGYAAEG
jgi:hypothetical protein